jgi:hypothetical protein
MTRQPKHKYHATKTQSAPKLPPSGIGAMLKRLAVRAGVRVLRFL